MSKLRVGIIFGGSSTEYKISLLSAKNIINFIDKSLFKVILIKIDQEGRWYVGDNLSCALFKDDIIRVVSDFTVSSNYNKKVALLLGRQPCRFVSMDDFNSLLQLDVIFPIVHGTIGEDGSLQGLLRICNLPFVGSDVLGSAISMNKDITKRLLNESGISVTPYIILTRSNRITVSFDKIVELLGIPLFIKPVSQGSSIGVSKVFDVKGFDQGLELAFNYDRKILVESAIIGRELECAVLGNDKPQVSECGEIILNDHFYTYKNKYFNQGKTQLIIPAVIKNELGNKIRDVALHAFKTLGCIGMARVDLFLTLENKILVNEVNTLPGFTKNSMYPRLWQASGLSYTELISQLIKLALERF